jgi:hypothetical protein
MFTTGRLFAIAMLLVSSTACVSTNAVRLGTGVARPAVPSTQVAVYRTANRVPRQYEEIALLNSTGASQWTNEAQMFESMRQMAGRMGANAVILDALSEPGAGAKVAAAVFGATTERKGRAIAVYVLPEGATLATRETVSPVESNLPVARSQTTTATGEIVSPSVPAFRTETSVVSRTEPQLPSVMPINSVASGAAAVPITKTVSLPRSSSVETERAKSVQRSNASPATSTVGMPSSEDARERAVDAYRVGKIYLGRHEWGNAEEKFREALRLDGSIAEYHGALGSVLLIMSRWVDAQASLSAAVLLDVDNAEYRRMLKEARSH